MVSVKTPVIFVKPACGEPDTDVTISVQCMCVSVMGACVYPDLSGP